MSQEIKKLTISENLDLALTRILEIEASLKKLSKILGGDNRRLTHILAEVAAMREEMEKLREERRPYDPS
jgi:hypothetical protein